MKLATVGGRRDPDRLAAFRRIGERALQHRLRLDLERRHVDEQIAARGRDIGVEGDHDRAALARLRQRRNRRVDVERRRDDAVGPLRHDVLVDLDLAFDVGGRRADIGELAPSSSQAFLAPSLRQLEEHEAGELRHVEDAQALGLASEGAGPPSAPAIAGMETPAPIMPFSQARRVIVPSFTALVSRSIDVLSIFHGHPPVMLVRRARWRGDVANRDGGRRGADPIG